MHPASIRSAAVLLLASMVLSACADADTKKRQHFEKGNQYAAEKRDDFAVVEYASAIEIDPKFGEARWKLAETYERMNNLGAAFPEYIRAADALPDNRELQLKATRILLLAGRFDDAKTRAEALLQKDPRDIDALLMRANAMAALRDPTGALSQIEEAMKIGPGRSEVYLNLGAVRMRSGDSAQAEAAFRQAIALQPDSIDARLALANFLWSAGRAPESEATLKEALAKDPQHLLANRMLGVLYASTNRMSEAEQPLKVVADVSKTPQARLQLVDYYVSAGRSKDAIALLTTLASDPATAGEAELRLAALDYAEKRTAEAHKRLDALLARTPNYAAALAVKAEWLTSENKLDEALERAKAAVAADPQAAGAHFALARAHDFRREYADAAKSYEEVLRLNPRAVVAQVELSRLNLRRGDNAAALRFAEEAKQTQPGSIEPQLAVARSLVAAGNLTRAETELASLLKQAPDSADVHAVNGTYLARKNNLSGARQAYDRALSLSPGHLAAITGLTYLDLAAKNPSQAIARLDAEIAKQPNNGSLLVLLGRVYGATGDAAKQEQAFRRAVTADPRLMEGYLALAQLYLRQNRVDAALTEFEGIVKREPSSVGARTMVGILLEGQGKRDEARKSYETTLNSTPNAPVAANNLAFIYAEQNTNLDMALQLATTAKQRLPDNPNVDDTLGWVYYKKDMAAQAVRPLEDSLKKLPDNAEVLYHLGLTYAKLGEKAKAKDALERALKIDPKVGGEEARRVLQSVTN